MSDSALLRDQIRPSRKRWRRFDVLQQRRDVLTDSMRFEGMTGTLQSPGQLRVPFDSAALRG